MDIITDMIAGAVGGLVYFMLREAWIAHKQMNKSPWYASCENCGIEYKGENADETIVLLQDHIRDVHTKKVI